MVIFNFLKNKKHFFLSPRFIFFVHRDDGKEAVAENADKNKKTKEKDPIKSPEEKERKLNEGGKGVNYDKNPDKVFHDMAEKVYKGQMKKEVQSYYSGKYAAELKRAMEEGVKNNTQLPLQEFWDFLASDNESARQKDPTLKPKNRCERVTVENGYFVFLDKNGQKIDNLPNMDKIKARVDGIPIEEEEESLGNREVNPVAKEAEAKEAERNAKIAEGKAIRKKFIVGGDRSGTIKFSNSEDWQDTTIAKLYPDAENGDTVYHKTLSGVKRTAYFHDGEWKYQDEKGDYDRVRINNGDTLAYVPVTHGQEKTQIQSPEGKEYMSHGYVKAPTDRAVPWEAYAKYFMYSGKLPLGDNFVEKTEKDKNPDPLSTQAVLEKLGYNPENPEDVKKIAGILKGAQINVADPIYITFITPEANPRIDREKMKAADERAQKQAGERELKTNADRYNDEKVIFSKHFNTLIKNENFKISAKVKDVVNDDKLWKAYWTDQFKGKEKIERGLALWGFKGNAREKLHDAITGTGLGALFDSNEEVDFADLLQYFEVYKDLDGKVSHDVGKFNKEMWFQEVGWKKAKNRERGIAENTNIDDGSLKNYDEMAKKYAGRTDLLNGSEYPRYVNIIKGAALMAEGLQTLDVRTPVEEIKAREERKAENREKNGIVRENGERFADSPEAAFLFKLLSPGENMAIEDMEEDGKKATEGAIVVQILYKASRSNKLDKDLMLNELNAYVRAGLEGYLNASATAKREMGEQFGLTQNDNDMKSLENKFFFKDLTYPQGDLTKLRNLLLKGFERKQGQGGTVETSAEVKPWKTLEEMKNDPEYKDAIAEQEKTAQLLEIADQAESPVLASTLRQWLLNNPKYKIEPKEWEKKVKEMDVAIKSTRLIDFGVGASFDANAPQPLTGLRVGVGKTIELGDGWQFFLGGGINVMTGQPFFGTGIVKGGNLSENLKGHIGAMVGVEAFKPTFFAGVDAGLTVVVPGELKGEKGKEEKWNTEVDIGAGAGVIASATLDDFTVGPYLRVGVTRKRDFQGEISAKIKADMEASGYDVIDQIADEKVKAAAIRTLRLGPEKRAYFAEAQLNEGFSDAQLVERFNQGKEALKMAALREVFDSASGVTEYGFGGVIGINWKLAMAVAFPFLIPALYGKLAFVVGKKITFTQELSRSKDEMQAAADKEFLEKLQAAYPDVQIEVKAQTFNSKEAIITNDFAGLKGFQRLLRTEQSPESVSKMEVNIPKGLEFSELQARFAENHLQLGLEAIEEGNPPIKMFTLEPTEVNFASYQIAVDPAMARENGIIVKNGKLFIAASRDLSELHIRRYDAFFPGEADGTSQHAFITISDNPYQKPSTILEDPANAYILESRFDKQRFLQTGNGRGQLEIVKNPVRLDNNNAPRTNLDTYENFKARGVFNQFYNAESLTYDQVSEVQMDTVRFKDALNLTQIALQQQQEFDKDANIDNVVPSPEDFIDDPKNAILYRKLTTVRGITKANIEGLEKMIDEQCRDNGKPLTLEQKILFAESVFHDSMAEYLEQGGTEQEAVDSRIKLAEIIYKPFFEQGLDRLRSTDPSISADITADGLLQAYLGGIRNHIAEAASPLYAGDSVDVMVGTKRIEGTRPEEALSGKTPEMKFRQAIDYTKYLNSKDPRHEEQRTIARILFNKHNELPAEGQDKEFLGSRLAKKLVFLGDEKRINPLIGLLDNNEGQSRNNFAVLIEIYKDLNAGRSIDKPEYKYVINTLRSLCEKIRNAQLGEGTPVLIDGDEMRAIYINGQYVMVQTTLESGIYDWCKNPSTVYNERLLFVKAKPGAKVLAPGSIISTAQDTALNYKAGANVNQIGIGAIGTVTFSTEVSRPRIPIIPLPNKPRIPITAPQPTGGTNVRSGGRGQVIIDPSVTSNKNGEGGE